ncbi:MAG: MFS transporter [Candidatus Heimdallarchaeota archaeon]|nr:MFS transporter [Candidatus Heimdallarchaeota archaeon]
MIQQQSKGIILAILSIAQLFGLSLWFVPNAVIRQLIPVFHLSQKDISSISTSVIIGFVLGSILLSVLNISDLIPSNRLFLLSSLLGSGSNLLLLLSNSLGMIIILRIITGIALAGIYPIGMKLTASHFKENRGLAIGVLLSALTVGSGSPYLFNLLGEPFWTDLIILVSVLAVIAGFLVGFLIETGPYVSNSSTFRISAVMELYRNKSIRLANYGYFGHMWELYTFWVWMPIMLGESYTHTHSLASDIEISHFFSLVSFILFLTGGIANIIGGYLADRIGRTTFNILMLLISGSSSLIIGLFYTNTFFLVCIAIIWGITIIPDSPQYSSMVTELSDPDRVGSALTMQTAIGFALTIVSIQIFPIILQFLGWTFVFSFLAIGPVLGIYSLITLRKQDNAGLIANGRK